MTAYEMRISDWSSDVCSSDLLERAEHAVFAGVVGHDGQPPVAGEHAVQGLQVAHRGPGRFDRRQAAVVARADRDFVVARGQGDELPQARRPGTAARAGRSEEHTSELQSLMRTSYAVFCLKKK